MTYPRMSKDEYPAIPETIQSDADYNLVLEYVVFSGIMIDDLREKLKNPFMAVIQRRKQEDIIARSMVKYDRMCGQLDDYKDRDWRDLHARAQRWAGHPAAGVRG